MWSQGGVGNAQRSTSAGVGGGRTADAIDVKKEGRLVY